MSEFSLAYCLGLIVGEGSFTASSGVPNLSVKLKNDLSPLAALQSQFGGKVYGPYSDGAAVWILSGIKLRDTFPTFDTLLPASRKREQYLVWRERHTTYFNKPDSRYTRNWSKS